MTFCGERESLKKINKYKKKNQRLQHQSRAAWLKVELLAQTWDSSEPQGRKRYGDKKTPNKHLFHSKQHNIHNQPSINPSILPSFPLEFLNFLNQ